VHVLHGVAIGVIRPPLLGSKTVGGTCCLLSAPIWRRLSLARAAPAPAQPASVHLQFFLPAAILPWCRDLKPENFLLESKAETAPIKCTDFGLSVFFKPGQKFKEVVGSGGWVCGGWMWGRGIWGRQAWMHKMGG